MSQERVIQVQNGWMMLCINLIVLLGGCAVFAYGVTQGANHAITDYEAFKIISGGVLATVLGATLLCGHFTLQPNMARVLILFGSYQGTVRTSGFHWTNPFATKLKRSLRAVNFVSEKLKVNDKRGNPVEIGVVIVWRIQDTAQATFDVNDCENFVRVQTESAVRHLANTYPYDHGEGQEPTLRSSSTEITQALLKELQDRLSKAGVAIDEARIAHLAYAPEIASVMLRRQQAEAVLSARQVIVHGAVTMVEMALKDLSDRKVVELDEERKAAMVGNLLVVLCSETETHPILNAGTLYH